MHYSRKYDNSPMPHSIFFLGGYAIHATYFTRQLGQPASHGCVRLHPRNAARLYALIEKHGLKSTRITIVN
jgi:lipoprotein-anchoring transpeptidase ErfK/SrfK